MTQTVYIRHEDENGEVTVDSVRQALTTALVYFLAATSDRDRAAVQLALAFLGRIADRLLTVFESDRLADAICQTVADNGDQELAGRIDDILYEAWKENPGRDGGGYVWNREHALSRDGYRAISIEKEIRERRKAPFRAFADDMDLGDILKARSRGEEPYHSYAEDAGRVIKRMAVEWAAWKARCSYRFLRYGAKYGAKEVWRRSRLDFPTLAMVRDK